ncbi:MAG: hypothetical protein R6U65_01605 [Perlabentimonas sp.]
MQKITTTILAAFLLLMGCSTPLSTINKAERKPKYRMQLGLNKGGVVENTDLSVIPNAQVDAYSGATTKGANASAKMLVPLGRNAVETGIELMHNGQTFSYNDEANGFYGKRKLGVSQLMIPVTYSLGVFKKNNAEGLFQVKVGYMLQLNILSVSDANGTLPNYSTNAFSNGATFGISTTPFRLNNGTKIGFYIDGYRGTQAYQDFYNRTDFEMPGTAFVKYGIIYQF